MVTELGERQLGNRLEGREVGPQGHFTLVPRFNSDSMKNVAAEQSCDLLGDRQPEVRAAFLNHSSTSAAAPTARTGVAFEEKSDVECRSSNRRDTFAQKRQIEALRERGALSATSATQLSPPHGIGHGALRSLLRSGAVNG